jgi:hypothetical protein
MSEEKNCEICHTELGPVDYRFHDDCKNCIYCGNTVGIDIIGKILKDEDGQTDVKILVFHFPCRDSALREELLNRPVTINQSHLDILNRSNLLFRQVFQSDPALSIETNQELSMSMARPYIVDMSLEEKYRTLKNIESVAAMCSILLGQKNKNEIKFELANRDAEKFKKVKEYREDTEKAKTERKEAGRKATERLDPKTRARNNAIDGLMKFAGMSREEAEESLVKKEVVQ